MSTRYTDEYLNNFPLLVAPDSHLHVASTIEQVNNHLEQFRDCTWVAIEFQRKSASQEKCITQSLFRRGADDSEQETFKKIAPGSVD